MHVGVWLQVVCGRKGGSWHVLREARSGRDHVLPPIILSERLNEDEVGAHVESCV